ncbi:MAG: hypothetical protein WA771_01830 [Chthoniobacterales bacterium]
MRATLLRALASAALVVILTGCGDQRGDSVREFVAEHAPPDTEFLGVTGNFQLEALGDHRFRTDVPVEYRTTADFVTVYDGFGTPGGEPVATRLDAIRAWATETLPAGDALRTSIERTWQQARYGFLLKRTELAADTKVDALVSLDLEPTADGGWLINQTATSFQIDGVAGGPPGIPEGNSAEAGQALANATATADKLEKLRADWEVEFERRAEAALARLNEQLTTGRIYAGTASGLPVEFVLSRGSDRSDDIVGVLRTVETRQSAARFVGRAERQPDGSAAWTGERQDLISPGSIRFFRPDDAASSLVLRSAESEGLEGGSADDAVGVKLPASRTVDLIPEPDGTL